MSCPTTLAFPTPSAFAREWIRIAEVFMSSPVLGIPESPMPGRSGAMTVNFSAKIGITGRHIREVSA